MISKTSVHYHNCNPCAKSKTKRREGRQQKAAIYSYNFLSVGLENCSTKATHDCFPRFPIKWDVTKSSRSSHVGHTCTATAPWARSSYRLARHYHPLLIHQKAEANHGFFSLIQKTMKNLSGYDNKPKMSFEDF